MVNLLNRFRIPTLLGLAVILLGTGAGVILTLQTQNLTTQAAPDQAAKEIMVTNLEDKTASISWQTATATLGYVKFGQRTNDEQTALDDRDQNRSEPRVTHHVTLKNLQPQTNYKLKIVSGKTSSFLDLTTSVSFDKQSDLKPAIGSVLDNNNFISEGLVYLKIDGAITQSSVIKNLGSFIIPLSNIRTSQLDGIYSPSLGQLAEIEIIDSAQRKSKIMMSLTDLKKPLPAIQIGTNTDLTIDKPLPLESSSSTTLPPPIVITTPNFDINQDGSVNASDHAYILNNFGTKFKDKKADLNSDGLVNQKDLDLMVEYLAKIGIRP